jgi:hypothetical protein
MPDKLSIENGVVKVTTDEGLVLEKGEADLVEMLRAEYALPLGDAALPDGVKFVQWQRPYLMVIHQTPPHVRRLQWIAEDSPCEFGPGTTYRPVRLSLPYAVTFALYVQHHNALFLTGYNELYFRNEPLRSRRDQLGFPALLNISAIKTPTRTRAWICTEHLGRPSGADWTSQLADLLNHTWNGGFNHSSEHHEGASWYGASRDVHEQLHPVQRWEQATEADERFGLQVPWQPSPLCVQEIIDAMIVECQQSSSMMHLRLLASRPASLIQRFINYVQTLGKKAS